MDRHDRAAEVNAQWHRMASATGVLDEDGVFLIDFLGNRAGHWFRVRLCHRRLRRCCWTTRTTASATPISDRADPAELAVLRAAFATDDRAEAPLG
ncbi:hypothetical protein [Streptomyces chartreusis]